MSGEGSAAPGGASGGWACGGSAADSGFKRDSLCGGSWGKSVVAGAEVGSGSGTGATSGSTSAIILFGPESAAEGQCKAGV